MSKGRLKWTNAKLVDQANILDLLILYAVYKGEEFALDTLNLTRIYELCKRIKTR